MNNNCIAVALPWHDGPRAAYLAPGEVAPVDPGAVLYPCADCSQILAVGPALALALSVDPSLDLCCPACGVGRCRGASQIVRVTLARNGLTH